MLEAHQPSVDSPETRPPSPLVSVIIRSLGRYTLREALDSVIRQTYPAIEIVVVNARGPEHPPLQDPYGNIPLRLCGTGQRLPRSRAANRGMEQARGQYLIFLDDDDWFEPEHINALVAGLRQHPHARVAYAGVQCLQFDNEGRSRCLLIYNSPFDHIRILFENFIPIHAVLFDRSLYEAGCRFDESLDLYEDWDFWLQLRDHGAFIHVDQVSAVYRIDVANNLGATANQGLIADGVQRIIHKWRNHWTDQELSRLFDYAKKGMVPAAWRQEQNDLLGELAQRKETEKNLTERLEAERQQSARQLHAEINTLHGKIHTLTTELQAKTSQLNTTTGRLQAIEGSTIWRISYPYRFLMNRLRSGLRKCEPPASQPRSGDIARTPSCEPNPHPVDIIVPVYKGFQETRLCLESLLASDNKTSHEIIVINDASPETELVAYLEALAASKKITFLHNADNVGFVLTCNRGMEQHAERDVVLLNSDTEVANDWLDRLKSCAYREERIGTVTPFSNNATICSYPRFCQDNDLPGGYSTPQLDRLFQSTNAGKAIDIPTAIGFCMYIRRACLAAVGHFDTQNFGKGYGEENDFSLRAKALGWRNVLCADTFVYHAGGVSFADHQNELRNKAIEKLKRIHPDYLPLVHRHIEQDPARPFRLAVDLARISESGLPNELFITGDSPMDTGYALDVLTQALLATAQVFMLHPGDDRQQVLSWLRGGEAFRLYFRLPADYLALQAFLRGLITARIHFHQMVGLPALLYRLPEQLGVPDTGMPHDDRAGPADSPSLAELLPFVLVHAYPRPAGTEQPHAPPSSRMLRLLARLPRLLHGSG
jgi:GT2 family glycosyltransferase